MKKFWMTVIFFVFLSACASKIVPFLEISVNDDNSVLSLNVANFSFDKGFVVVRIDGVAQELHNTTLPLTLSTGTHTIAAELMKADNTSYGVVKEINVSVAEKKSGNLAEESDEEIRIMRPENNFLTNEAEVKMLISREGNFTIVAPAANITATGTSISVPLAMGKNTIVVSEGDVSKQVVVERFVPCIGDFEIFFPTQNYNAKGNLIAVNLKLDDFNFGEVGAEDKDRHGYFLLWLDNSTAPIVMNKNTFTLRNLYKGDHKLTVEMVRNDGSSCGKKKVVEFSAQTVTG